MFNGSRQTSILEKLSGNSLWKPTPKAVFLLQTLAGFQYRVWRIFDTEFGVFTQIDSERMGNFPFYADGTADVTRLMLILDYST